MENNKYEKDSAFFEEFHALLQKHGMMLLSGNADNVKNAAKSYNGLFMFVSDGSKKPILQDGESIDFPFKITTIFNSPESSTLKITKNRYKPENHGG